jgi:hypothetical protein
MSDHPIVTLLATTILLACSGSGSIELDAVDRPEPDVQINLQTGCQADDECDDGNSCTRNLCQDDGECTSLVMAGQPCDDGNACTQDDQCSPEGTCNGAGALGCNDNKLCTEDSCDPKSGCIFAPFTLDMECDGSLCTTGDSCVEGVCAAGQVKDCPEVNPTDCLFHVCDNTTGECTVVQNQPEGFPCADANPCTDADACDANGICQSGSPHECVSQNPCKTAWCNEQAKEGTNPCVTDFVAEGTPCNDDSKCTDNDACSPVGDGSTLQCQGVPVDCNDGNPCSLDTCDEAVGCAFEDKSNGTPCDLVGGGKGTCQEGICQDGDPTDCNDNIACTIDLDLGNGQCQHTPDHSFCTDNQTCNGMETCDIEQGCLPGVGLNCDDNVVCTDDSCNADGCIHTINHSLCDDSNPCTLDSCNGVACIHSPQAGNCSDNDPCTTGESCSNGLCTGGQPTLCDDGIDCTVDSCVAGKGCDFDDSNCAGECDPYAVVSCYEGPANTAGTGRCKSGYKQCRGDGSGWSPCYDMQIPLGEDLCDNGIDDDCDGTQTDQNCSANVGGAVWADYDHGSDATGNGSYSNPYQTITKALTASQKTIAVKADANGTIYPEDVVKIGGSKHWMVMVGVGPTRPVLSGTVDITHCYDCTFENLELRYPDPGHFAPDDTPAGAIDAVHNYRNTWRQIRFSAPEGLPSGEGLADCHHGYDNLFIDIEIADIKLLPSPQGDASFLFFDWGDHGSGSQFIRVTWLGPITLSGPAPQGGSLGFIRVGGYAGDMPDGVSAIRNVRVGGFDLQSLLPQASFTGIDTWVYYDADSKGGLMVANNTFADISAASATLLSINQPFTTPMQIVGNIFGPVSGTSKGVDCNAATTITYSDFFGLTTKVSGNATLGAGTMDEDPNFGPQYTLSGNSPCLDTGNPAWTDPNGSAADMGAYGGPLAK